MRTSVKGFVSGHVQGVGFRYFVRRHAVVEGVSGYARNLPDGRVEFLLQGEADAVERVVAAIRRGPNYASVQQVEIQDAVESPPVSGFVTG